MKKQGEKRMKIVTVHGSRQLKGAEATAVRVAASRAILERTAAKAEPDEVVQRPADAPNVEKAMAYVEARLVLALWVLARLPDLQRVGFATRNGIPYLPERIDFLGGREAPPPRPAPPSSKAIDAMNEPLDWLRLVGRDAARLLTLGAQSKRGDPKRNVAWARIRQTMPELHGLSTRTLQRRYVDGFRAIVTELALAK